MEKDKVRRILGGERWRREGARVINGDRRYVNAE
jgi:hypothetical protein